MIVVVGGQTRNSGKTTVICDVIRRHRELGWTAIKISRHSHREHRVDSPKNDTARFAEAGAVETVLLRSPTPAETLELLTPYLNRRGALIIESNSVLEVIEADFYVLVVSPDNADVKDSARRFVHRADALVSCSPAAAPPEFAAGRTLMSVGEMLALLGERILHCDRKTA